MKNIPFYKYQGAGNDFILINQMKDTYLTHEQDGLIRLMCDRRFGIGADGLMLLSPSETYDFRMLYFNADGKEGSMCGNGGRCIVNFAFHQGLIHSETQFVAVDGPHEAILSRPNYVQLKMQDVDQIEVGDDYFLLDTGSPHYIKFVQELDSLAVVPEGKAIRYSDRFAREGVNVNFVASKGDDHLAIATYERGVEDETLACGTGVTAAAIAHALQEKREGPQSIQLKARGGNLEVRFEISEGTFHNVWLCGPAEKVFQGTYPIAL